MRILTQTAAAKELGIKQPGIARLVREGKIKKYDKGKIDIDELQTYRAASGQAKKGIDVTPASNPKKVSEAMAGLKDIDIMEARRQNEILKVARARVALTEDKIKLEALKGEYVLLSEAKEYINKVHAPLSVGIDQIPLKLREQFPETTRDAIDWLIDHINSLKIQAQNAS